MRHYDLGTSAEQCATHFYHGGTHSWEFHDRLGPVNAVMTKTIDNAVLNLSFDISNVDP